MTEKQIRNAIGEHAILVDVRMDDNDRLSLTFRRQSVHEYRKLVIDAHAQGTEEAWLEVQVK